MKFVFSLIIFLFVVHFQVLAQWAQQYSGTAERLQSNYFVNENIGWVTGDYGTILKTTDGGDSWISQSVSTNFNNYSIFFNDSLQGWIAEYNYNPFRQGKVLHTSDGGNSWVEQFYISNFLLHSIYFSDPRNGWVVGSNGITFNTTDGGVTWNEQYVNTQGWLFSVYFYDNRYGWTVGNLLGVMFKTTDGGMNWISQNIPTNDWYYSVFFISKDMGWTVGENGQVIKTENGGASWFIKPSSTSSRLRDVQFVNENEGWAVGHNGTIIHSVNGGDTWEVQNSGTNYDLYSVHFVNDTTGWVVGDNGIILKYVPPTTIIDWCNLQYPPEYEMTEDDTVDILSRIFVNGVTNQSGPGSGILGWIGYNEENTNPETWTNWVSATYLQDIGGNDEYHLNLTGLPQGVYYYASRFQLNNGDYYYGGYPDGFWDGVNNVSGVLTITPASTIDWCNLESPAQYLMTESDSVEIFSQVWVNGVTELPGEGEGILGWIGYSAENTNPSLWNNWIPANYKDDIGANDRYSSYIGNLDTGIYYYASRFQLNNGDYYYGGYPNGFWDGINNVSGILTITPVVSVDEINSPPTEYSLQQNYPNPFNPTTKIRFTIPVTGFTTLKVFDVLGNEVATLVNKELPPGKYEIDFIGENLSSGIYYYKLQSGNFISVKKMILMK